jgi:hypothetical protein
MTALVHRFLTYHSRQVSQRLAKQPVLAEIARLGAQASKSAQHAASAPNSANGKAEGAARIKGARSQGEDAELAQGKSVTTLPSGEFLPCQTILS